MIIAVLVFAASHCSLCSRLPQSDVPLFNHMNNRSIRSIQTSHRCRRRCQDVLPLIRPDQFSPRAEIQSQHRGFRPTATDDDNSRGHDRGPGTETGTVQRRSSALRKFITSKLSRLINSVMLKPRTRPIFLDDAGCLQVMCGFRIRPLEDSVRISAVGGQGLFWGLL